jgi:hypothetical protein
MDLSFRYSLETSHPRRHINSHHFRSLDRGHTQETSRHVVSWLKELDFSSYP